MPVRAVPSPHETTVVDRLRQRIDDLVDERERQREVIESLSAENGRLRDLVERYRRTAQHRHTAKAPRSRVYTRKFDWEEARRLRAQGWSYAAIARHLSVSPAAVRRVCDPVYAEKVAARSAEFQAGGTCPECGGPASRNGLSVQHRCRECAAAAQATSVRPESLWCSGCETWKPDEDFPSNRTLKSRRGRSRRCRPCQTEMKRAWRRRNPATCVRCGGPATPDSRSGHPARVCAGCYRKLKQDAPHGGHGLTLDELLALEREAA